MRTTLDEALAAEQMGAHDPVKQACQNAKSHTLKQHQTLLCV